MCAGGIKEGPCSYLKFISFFPNEEKKSLYTVLAMSAFRVSYVSMLQALAEHCFLSYVSTVHETIEDDSHLYGVELELPYYI